MRTPIPLQVRRELWAWRYAQRAFEHCRHCCDHVVREHMDDSHPLYFSLTLAAYVNYARPFKRSRGLERLPERIVPRRMTNVHNQIIAARDKLYAHVDVNGFNPWDEEQDVDVRVIGSGREITIACLEVTPKVIGLQIISELAGTLEGKCRYHLQKIVSRHRRSLPSSGEFSVGVREGEPDLIEVDPSAFHDS